MTDKKIEKALCEKYGVELEEDIYPCENCPKNNNAEWNERTCPLRAVGECEVKK